jgi:isoquinoline 1-oxidoreductase subunit alpha
MIISVNGEARSTTASSDTPLLYVLRNELNVLTPKFGCGMAQCGACSVLLDGVEVRSCITPLASVGKKQVTTVEGLPARWEKLKALVHKADRLHPVQQAWDDEQVPQCGICQYGMMIKVVELLEHNPKPSDTDINAALTTSGPSPHLCRCASYAAIREGVHRAAKLMAGEA